MTDKQKIIKFLEKLSLDQAPFNNAVNPYTNHIKKENLKQYLLHMLELSPDAILVGEAPGWRGALQTGVPFTSEEIMLRSPLYLKASPGPIHKEQSAKIVWRAVKKLEKKPVFWNIYPFHPHGASASSNRTPTSDELAYGFTYLKEFLTLFPNLPIGAVGRKAEQTIKEHGIDTMYIRHPSYNGEALFVKHLTKFYGFYKQR